MRLHIRWWVLGIQLLSVATVAQGQTRTSKALAPAAAAGQSGGATTTLTVDAKAPEPIPLSYVVFFTPQDPNGSSDNIITFSTSQLGVPNTEACQTLRDTGTYKLTDVATLITCASGDQNLFSGKATQSLDLTIDVRARAAGATLGTVKAHAKEGSARIYGDQHSKILAAVLTNATFKTVTERKKENPKTKMTVEVDGPVADISFKDDEQESQLSADLQNLASIAFSIAAAKSQHDDLIVGEIGSEDAIWLQYKPHLLQYKRDRVIVTQTFKAVAPLASDYAPEKLQTWQINMTEANVDFVTSQCATVRSGKPGDTPAMTARLRSPFAMAACLAVEPTETAAVRVAAVESLGRIHTDETPVVLRRIVADQKSDNAVKAAAAKALMASDPAASSRDVSSPAADKKDAALTTTLISGPHEHWYLSADVLLTSEINISQDSQGQLQVGKPPDFYVGVNYLLGDLKTTERPWYGNLIVKGFVKATKRPEESYGAGIGLRGKYANFPALNFEIVSPFAAITRSRVETNGVVSHRNDLRAGVSVNLDKALGWVKGDDKKN
jgi:hypothetical protein